jgi:RNA recognition motif-containing protein
MDTRDSASAEGYRSCFDQPTADEPNEGGDGESLYLSDATAALLNPTILKMFVDSLTRSITGNDSQSILSIDPVVSPTTSAREYGGAPVINTPTLFGDDYVPSPPGLDSFNRSATNVSILSNNTAEGQTTVMLRNVPYDARQRGVLSLIEEEGFKGRFDFFYAPLDFKSRNNLGYAFVNLTTPESATEFTKHFDGMRVVSRPGWEKPLRVCSARVQGLESNIDHYKNSPVNEMPVEFKPMIFSPEGTFIDFPEPDMNVFSREETRRSVSGGLSRSGSGPLGGATVRPRERRLQSQLSRGFLTPVHASVPSSISSSLLTRTPQPASAHANKLFIGGLSPETTSELLGEYLKRFGQLDDCHVLMDVTTGRSRCYGFCTFKSAEGAQAALGYQRTHWIDGRGAVIRPYTSNQ